MLLPAQQFSTFRHSHSHSSKGDCDNLSRLVRNLTRFDGKFAPSCKRRALITPTGCRMGSIVSEKPDTLDSMPAEQSAFIAGICPC